MKFKNREQAGQLLAHELEDYRSTQCVILAIPRGGVPVAAEVARELHKRLDTLVVRKLGAPTNPEYGFGAIAPGDVVIFDQAAIHSLELTQKDIDAVAARERIEMEHRLHMFESGKWSVNEHFDTVILVDDGLATGVSALAAIESAKIQYTPQKVVLAVPVCARDSKEILEQKVDEFVCLYVPEEFTAVGYWYKDFRQVSTEEALKIIETMNRNN